MSSLDLMAQVIGDTEAVLNAFLVAREQSSTEQWDEWQDNPLLSPLFDALSDLEDTAEIE